MTDRKGLSKKTRFEVFKRDKFTCQYCGRSAPDIVLEVDHIRPVKEGGTNDILNLVTSCRDCNQGKGARELSDDSVIKKTQAQMQELAERNEQLSMLLEWRSELRRIEDRQVDEVLLVINEMHDGISIGLTSGERARLRAMLKKHSFQTILDAAESSAAEFFANDHSIYHDFSILLRQIERNVKQREDPLDEHKRAVYYLRKILINRFNLERCWVEKKQLFEIISDLLSNGISFDALKEICCNIESYNDFFDEAVDLASGLNNGTTSPELLEKWRVDEA